MKKFLLGCLFAVSTVLSAPSVHAQADLTFSGGSGAPLIITLNHPVSFVITSTAYGNSAPVFNFEGVGNVLNLAFEGVIGGITFEVDNDGFPRTLDTASSGYSGGDFHANDLYITGYEPGLNEGDVVTLAAGTLTTLRNVAAPAPADGSYTVFIANGTISERVSQDGVLIPEPSTWTLLGLGAAGAGIVVLRRRRTLA